MPSFLDVRKTLEIFVSVKRNISAALLNIFLQINEKLFFSGFGAGFKLQTGILIFFGEVENLMANYLHVDSKVTFDPV